MSKKPPQILDSRWLTHSRLFHIQQLELKFSNGERRTYERLNPWHHGAVMIVPLLDDDTVVLVREYGAGIGDYYLSFPKGALHAEESVLDAANRELMEEAGFGAHNLEVIDELALSPSYMGNRMTLVLATGLFEKKLPGDEPEPLEVITAGLFDNAVLADPQFRESYAVAALLLTRERCR